MRVFNMVYFGGPRKQPAWVLDTNQLHVVLATGWWQRFWGLHLWSDWGASPCGLLFAKCNSVHTLALRQPIDIAFISKAGELLKFDACAKPNRIYTCKNAYYVLELPANSAFNNYFDGQKYWCKFHKNCNTK